MENVGRDKANNKIDWKDINNSLTEQQKGIMDINQAELDQRSRHQMINSIDMKTEYWKQRAKSRWDEFGDNTSAYFYKSEKGRSVKDTIKAIKDQEGNWIKEQSHIKNIFLTNFKGLYQPSTNNDREQILPEDPFLSPVKTLSQHHLDLLNIPFTNEEIKEACFCSKPLKSPGPDGVPPIFFQKNWDIVEADVYNSVHSFVNSGFILREQNETYITLIPKKDRPQETKGFRPISLCNSSYKIISKNLVN